MTDDTLAKYYREPWMTDDPWVCALTFTVAHRNIDAGGADE